MWDREPTQPQEVADAADEKRYRQAERNARLAAEAFFRCHRYVQGWLAHADPQSGLIPRNLSADRHLWNGRDSAADNYPFMVLTCALTDRPLFEGRMRDILRAEQRLTSRIDRLGDHWSFKHQGFVTDKPNLDQIIFDNAEYVKDGLIPLAEWLGPSPWSERMTGLVEDIWKHAPIDTPSGKIPTLNFEVNGDLLQACSRLYWFSGDRRFLDWAVRLGDWYLLSTNHPTRNFKELRLIDHGCEVVNGLSELYFAVSRAWPEKAQAYREPLHAVFQRILEAGRNSHGLLYVSFNPQTAAHAEGLCDTWGYVYDGFYTLYLVDQTAAYREATRLALSSLNDHYRGNVWADRSADGFADSIEGGINLLNREPIPPAAEWIDHQVKLMWAVQKADGVVEGWHGDGNFARTSIMYALWKTQGLRLEPWRPDLRVGAVRDGAGLKVSLGADQPWTGKLVFDSARHRLNMRLPLDYPRINQFPEWFVAEADKTYRVEPAPGQPRVVKGKDLLEGYALQLRPGSEVRLRISGT